jgi:RNA polymerase primary sigma factor
MTDDILTRYYSEAAVYKLLSRQEEIKLFKVFHKWSNNRGRCGQRTRKKGKEARELLIKSNLRLVIKIAHDYKTLGLDLADLISEGNIGLIKAVDKFKLDKGAKLSHYASFWIKQSVMRALANSGRTIRLPAGAVQQKLKILKYASRFEGKNNHKPSNQEIAKYLKLSVDRVVLLQEALLTVPSLNVPLKTDGGGVSNGGNEGVGTEIGDHVADVLIANPSVLAEKNSNNRVLNKCLNKLDHREKYIIQKRFGFNELKPHTLEVIGKKFGITRERIRQIETIAMKKLKRLMGKEMKINR